MNNRISKYLDKNLSNVISKNYRFFINTENALTINYFFWLNNEIYLYNNSGFCIKNKKKHYFHMDSFILYYFLRNMKINQLFFTSTPFIFFLKKKGSERLNKKIYLL